MNLTSHHDTYDKPFYSFDYWHIIATVVVECLQMSIYNA